MSIGDSNRPLTRIRLSMIVAIIVVSSLSHASVLENKCEVLRLSMPESIHRTDAQIIKTIRKGLEIHTEEDVGSKDFIARMAQIEKIANKIQDRLAQKPLNVEERIVFNFLAERIEMGKLRFVWSVDSGKSIAMPSLLFLGRYEGDLTGNSHFQTFLHEALHVYDVFHLDQDISVLVNGGYRSHANVIYQEIRANLFARKDLAEAIEVTRKLYPKSFQLLERKSANLFQHSNPETFFNQLQVLTRLETLRFVKASKRARELLGDKMEEYFYTSISVVDGALLRYEKLLGEAAQIAENVDVQALCIGLRSTSAELRLLAETKLVKMGRQIVPELLDTMWLSPGTDFQENVDSVIQKIRAEP